MVDEVKKKRRKSVQQKLVGKRKEEKKKEEVEVLDLTGLVAAQKEEQKKVAVEKEEKKKEEVEVLDLTGLVAAQKEEQKKVAAKREYKLERGAYSITKLLEKEFEEAEEHGIDTEKIVTRPSGRSTSFLGIRKEPGRYVVPKRRIIKDKFGTRKVIFV